jgi:hypothetical protein
MSILANSNFQKPITQPSGIPFRIVFVSRFWGGLRRPGGGIDDGDARCDAVKPAFRGDVRFEQPGLSS